MDGWQFVRRYWWLVFVHPAAILAWVLIIERLTRGFR